MKRVAAQMLLLAMTVNTSVKTEVIFFETSLSHNADIRDCTSSLMFCFKEIVILAITSRISISVELCCCPNIVGYCFILLWKCLLLL